MNITKDDGLYTDYGQKLRGNMIDAKELLQRLGTMEGSKTAKDAIEWIERVVRLTLPVYMTLIEQAMIGNPHPDEARLFNFMGSGCSDFTFVAEWRALFGDEREDLVELDKALKWSKNTATKHAMNSVLDI